MVAKKVMRKLTAARHALMIAKQAQRSGSKSLPVYKRGRPGVQSKLRCRVGVSGEKERKRLKARKEFLAAGGSLLLDGTDFFSQDILKLKGHNSSGTVCHVIQFALFFSLYGN